MKIRVNLASSGAINSNIKQLVCVPDENGLPVPKILIQRMEFEGEGDKKVLKNIKPVTSFEEISYDALCDMRGSYLYSGAYCDLDSYFRQKLWGSPLYGRLYGPKENSAYDLNDIIHCNSSLQARVLYNLIKMDVKTLEYIDSLFASTNKAMGFARFLSYFSAKENISKSAPPRRQLGLSKRKILTFQEYKDPNILLVPNQVFDDDLDFLMEFAQGDEKLALTILQIKALTPTRDFEDIIRAIVKLKIKDMIIRPNRNSFFVTAKILLDRVVGFMEMKEDSPNLKLTLTDGPTIEHSSGEIGKSSSQSSLSKFVPEVDGYLVVQPQTNKMLWYAMSVTNAYSANQIKDAQKNNSIFFYAEKGKHRFMIEMLGDEIVSVCRNYQPAINIPPIRVVPRIEQN